MFENHQKYRIWIFQFRHFPSIFVQLKVTCLLTLFDYFRFSKTRRNGLFLEYFMNVCPLCKCSSLRSQCWMRLYLWFSNIVCLKSLELFWGYLLVYVRDYYKILQMKQLVLASLWYFRMNALQRLILAPKFIYPKSDFLNFFLNFSRKNSKIFFQNSKKLPNLT